jgi:putative FmdB family regulatory protein
MPIYAYKCDACGHRQDTLQKMSDSPLSICPACGAARFQKQLTAAGFQLKGSGWYVTDFRNGNNGAAAKADDEAKPKAGEGEVPASGGEPVAAPSPAQADTSAAATTSPAATPVSAKPAAAAAASGNSSSTKTP